MATEKSLVRLQQKLDAFDQLPMDIAGYYFDIITEHSVSLQSTITDNWMENNTAISDHIANQPVVISLRGLSGELTYVPDDTETLYLLMKTEERTRPSALEKLSKLTSLYPPLDNVSQSALNQIDSSAASVNRYVGLVTSFMGNPYSATKDLLDKMYKTISQYDHPLIKKTYDRLETMRLQKLPFEVKTPFRTFKDMYIQSVTFSQGNVLHTADIEITFKQAYFVDTLTTKADEKVVAQIQEAQRSEEKNHGRVQGNNKSLAAKVIDGDDWSFFDTTSSGNDWGFL